MQTEVNTPTNSNMRQPVELIKLIGEAKGKIKDLEGILAGLEDELITIVDSRDPDVYGAKTYEVGTYKVSIDRPLNVAVPAADIQKMESDFNTNKIPLSLMPFKMKPEFNITAYKALADLSNASDAHKIASKYVTSKPGKRKIKIEV